MRLHSAWAASVAALVLPLLTSASSLTPPVLPLVVRNPYLSTWLQDARNPPWTEWPMFWTGEHVGFSVLASLPHERLAFPLLGRPHDSLSPDDHGYNITFPKYLGSQYDASTTNLSYSIQLHSGKHAYITLSFLSPITPTSTLRQSIPAAYLNVEVSDDVDLDIYVDLNGQWVSGDRGNRISWDLLDSVDADKHRLKTWAFHRETQQHFTEIRDQSEWGTLHFSAPPHVRHEAGVSSVLRRRFARTGTLENHVDNGWRGIMDAEPVFAFSKSFRANTSDNSVLFTIAHVQDPVVQYAAARGLTLLRPLWASYFGTEAMLHFHYRDFHHASKLAAEYSAQLAVDAYKSGANDYVDIVAISARQVLGATHFLGTPDDPLLFMKEISSDGNTQTIDVIFPSFPFFLYTNPRWLSYLLEPLIEHMLSGQYPNDYAMHDIGASYPNATGHPDGNDEYMPVEECGNILIMGLALANSIKDGFNSSVPSGSIWKQTSSPFLPSADDMTNVFPLSTGEQDSISYIDEAWAAGPQSMKQAQKWIQRSYKLWKQWTGYLVKYSLEPHLQLSTDDFAGWLALQTNLALKGILGIKAMSGLAEIAGYKDDVKTYDNISRTYIARWEELGMSRDKTHAKLAYDWYGSWTTTYNLFADSLLCFHLEEQEDTNTVASSGGHQHPIISPKPQSGFVPKHIYTTQSRWYANVRQKYGLPLDSRHLYTKTDWEFFAMAVASPSTRSTILESVAKWVNETNTDRPLTDLHNTEGKGEFPGPNFFARPVIGGHFAFLALERACGGKAMDGLSFIAEAKDIDEHLDVEALLAKEALRAQAESEEL